MLCVAGCDKSPEAESKDALRDVGKACAHMAAWSNRLKKSCTRCLAFSTTPKCNCPRDTEEYSGKCYLLRQAQVDDKACEPVSQCVYKCARTDCACIERCYENQARCRELASAVDGCVAEVCDPHCR